MKSILAAAVMAALLMGPAHGANATTVWCANCSERGLLGLQKAQTAEEIHQLMVTYDEAVKQTQHQLDLLHNNLEQYRQMVRNATTLPREVLGKFNSELRELAVIGDELRTLKGDYLATVQYFDASYPGYDALKGLMAGDQGLSPSAFFEKWTREADRASQDTFKMTSYQLHDLASNSADLESYINGDLLRDDLSEVQTLQSAAKLAAIQVSEAQKTRALLATSLQSSSLAAARDEKDGQLAKGMADKLLSTAPLEKMYRGYYQD